ncbi:MAG: hypothetical protein EOP85_00400 [Verrucomicrobiaceae bacterium]|nr:MAG: hypothetical protein EOP85_00400 [Verrucomicrobiaceae bacterium]
MPTPEEAAADRAAIEAREPDHLVPFDGDPADWKVRYAGQLRKRLGLESPFYIEMLVQPSFSPEYAVSLIGGPYWGADPASEEKLTLRYSIGDKSIWYSIPENNKEKVQKEVTVETKTVDFPKAQGVRIHKLWDRMIGRVRFPEEVNSGLDGTTFAFATRRGRGEVWSPQSRKSPLLLVELGHGLIDYCKAPEEKRADVLKEIVVKIGRLEKYLDEHPVNLK